MLKSLINKISLGLVVILLFSIIGCVKQGNNNSGDSSSNSNGVSSSSTVSNSESSSEDISSEIVSSSESSSSETESGTSSSVSSGSSSSSVSSVSGSTSVSSSNPSSSSVSSSNPSSSSSSSSSVSSSSSSSSSVSSTSSASSTPSSSSSSSISSSSVSSSSQSSTDSFYDGWTLEWSDEFNGPSVNTTIWRLERGAHIRNEELQYYNNSTTDGKNVYIEDGCLVIKTIKESQGGVNYTSASLRTEDRRSFKFGRIEMRAKLPYGPGIWPAFWMCGEQGTWPDNGEIDIMEFWGGPDQDNIIKSNVHWNQNGHRQWGARSFALSGGQRFADDFHVIGMDWDENSLKFYVDGQYHNTFYFDTQLLKDVFTKEFYLWINTAVSPHKPEWGWGDANLNTYPQYYIIDYIRVYQQSN